MTGWPLNTEKNIPTLFGMFFYKALLSLATEFTCIIQIFKLDYLMNS